MCIRDRAPSAPTRLYYCGGDEQVPFQNSLIAETTMQANGAADVLAVNLNPTFSHGQCVFPAILSSIDFFQSFVNPSSISGLDLKAQELKISPNPVSYTHLDVYKRQDRDKPSVKTQ